MTDQSNILSRLIENPIFYSIGIVVGLIGWWFKYLEDGHLIVVLVAGIVGLVRYFKTRHVVTRK
jgi:hypothetical protein